MSHSPASPTAPWWLALVLSAVSLGWAGYTSYTHNDKELAQRLTVVETRTVDHAKEDDGREHAETERLDRLETKLDRLLDWALGSHK